MRSQRLLLSEKSVCLSDTPAATFARSFAWQARNTAKICRWYSRKIVSHCIRNARSTILVSQLDDFRMVRMVERDLGVEKYRDLDLEELFEDPFDANNCEEVLAGASVDIGHCEKLLFSLSFIVVKNCKEALFAELFGANEDTEARFEALFGATNDTEALVEALFDANNDTGALFEVLFGANNGTEPLFDTAGLRNRRGLGVELICRRCGLEDRFCIGVGDGRD